MTKVIPKEQLTAYQRWELAAFDEVVPLPSPPQPEPPVVEEAPPEPAEPELILPTAEEIENLQQRAWQEAYQLGMEEGQKAGLAANQEAAKPYFTALNHLVETLTGEQLHKDEEVAREVLALSVVMAQQILRNALKIKPELILDAIREALKTLPALNGQYTVVTHPDTANTVRDWLEQEQKQTTWRVQEDAQMEPGDFRFDSTFTELDGTLRTRWQELIANLDADPSWLL
jgi:flagellar assembly protein FliH